jgi:hypothetical protein
MGVEACERLDSCLRRPVARVACSEGCRRGAEGCVCGDTSSFHDPSKYMLIAMTHQLGDTSAA